MKKFYKLFKEFQVSDKYNYGLLIKPLKKITISILLFFPILIIAQDTQNKSILVFDGDFRFRIEQDWDSKKYDGSFREDRTRLRYRIRLGLKYEANDWLAFGARIRTGEPNKQQDPHLTLGGANKEFSGLPLAFEKVYAMFNYHWLSAWVGKNTYPFEKQNELFWSDNVYPEGVSVSGNFNFENTILKSLSINAGHFVVITQDKSLSEDSYFQGLQLVSSLFNNKVTFFPGFYYFNKMPNIPDGQGTYTMNYSILNLGTTITVLQKPAIVVGIDYYNNFNDLTKNDLVAQDFRNQKQGFVATTTLGKLEDLSDWKFTMTYSHLERYAAIDYFAQNDWARWDYSSQGSSDGRLTNFKGFEIETSYAISKKINLKLRLFSIKQIVPFGITKENGNRIRLDLNIKM